MESDYNKNSEEVTTEDISSKKFLSRKSLLVGGGSIIFVKDKD